MTPQEINNLISEHFAESGLAHFGVVALEKPLSFDFYRSWLNEGLHGDMKYLADHAPIKEKPQTKWPRAQSALVFAVPYFPHPEPTAQFPLKKARVSLYAQGMDYHFWFKDRMNQACVELSKLFPEEEFIAFTDSSPVLERDLARKAGIGWVGKNTCIIHPKKGSLFFLGEIYTSLKFSSEISLLPDFCGTCTRCIDICPTEALIEPRKMDARKCISYLTIESRTIPEESLREKIGDWFFGCDLCQTVCPWNQKVFKNQLQTERSLTLEADELHLLIEDLRYVLRSSGKKLSKDLAGTPLARAGSFGLKRNALIVTANRKIVSLRDEVALLLNHEKLGALAAWTLERLDKEPKAPAS